MKYFITLFIGQIIGVCLYHYLYMPNEIDERAIEYGLMRYDSKQDKMVVKDSVKFDEYTLQYLKYGKTK